MLNKHQKLIQGILIWIVPIIGSFTIHYFSKDHKKTGGPNYKNENRKDDSNFNGPISSKNF